MRFDTSITAQAGQTGATDAQLDKLLKRAKSDAAGAAPASKEDAKIAKAGRDFESILLGSWLQQAESSFGSVPGGDGEDEDDSGKEQFQGISMQALAGKLTASGGIGIAKMISSHLHAAADKAVKAADPTGKEEISEKKKIS
jgi:Rod binding domain-containing protein